MVFGIQYLQGEHVFLVDYLGCDHRGHAKTGLPGVDSISVGFLFAIWFGWLSLAVFTGMSVILILQRVFGISLM